MTMIAMTQKKTMMIMYELPVKIALIIALTKIDQHINYIL